MLYTGGNIYTNEKMYTSSLKGPRIRSHGSKGQLIKVNKPRRRHQCQYDSLASRHQPLPRRPQGWRVSSPPLKWPALPTGGSSWSVWGWQRYGEQIRLGVKKKKKLLAWCVYSSFSDPSLTLGNLEGRGATSRSYFLLYYQISQGPWMQCNNKRLVESRREVEGESPPVCVWSWAM